MTTTARPSQYTPRVKICCIASIEEAHLAIRQGAAALGLVSAMPSGPGVIDEELIAAIAAQVPPPIATFLLTSSQDPEQIIDQQRRCRTNTLQLVDSLALGAYARLRAALPGIALVQVIHVTGEAALDEAGEIAPYVDALLLDSGNPNLAVKELGGTGRTHNWEVSRQDCREARETGLLGRRSARRERGERRAHCATLWRGRLLWCAHQWKTGFGKTTALHGRGAEHGLERIVRVERASTPALIHEAT